MDAMLRTFVAFLCFCSAVPASAKLGESVPQLLKRFGSNYTVEPVEMGKMYKFRSENVSVDAIVAKGRPIPLQKFRPMVKKAKIANGQTINRKAPQRKKAEPGDAANRRPRTMTLIEIRPHRWGWKAFEAPGVEPVCPEKRQAIDYAKTRACFRTGEIRILDSTGKLEGPLAFSEADRML
jgi:hypothetical protein